MTIFIVGAARREEAFGATSYAAEVAYPRTDRLLLACVSFTLGAPLLTPKKSGEGIRTSEKLNFENEH